VPNKGVMVYFRAFCLTMKYLKKRTVFQSESKVELKLRPVFLKHPNCRLFWDQE